jgi:hypothetical protein
MMKILIIQRSNNKSLKPLQNTSTFHLQVKITVIPTLKKANLANLRKNME